MRQEIKACTIAFATASVCLPAMAQTNVCSRQYLEQVDTSLPDVIDFGPNASLTEAVEQAYGCAVESDTIDALAGMNVTYRSGGVIGKLSGIAVYPGGKNAVAIVKRPSSAFFRSDEAQVAVPLQNISEWSDAGVSTTYTSSLDFDPPKMVANLPSTEQRAAPVPFSETMIEASKLSDWFDSLIRLVLPPTRVPLEIRSEPLQATIFLEDRDLGLTIGRKLIRESVMQDISLAKDGYQTCHFSDATYRHQTGEALSQLSCTLSKLPAQP